MAQLLQSVTNPIANWQDRKARARAAEKMNAAMQTGYGTAGEQNKDTWAEIQSKLTPTMESGQRALTSYEAQSSPEAFNQYLTQHGFNPDTNWTQNPENFVGTGVSGNVLADTNRFLDPSMQFRMDQGVKAMDTSAASKGGLFSGSYGKELQNYSQDLASTEYGKAFTRAQDTNDRAYKNWQDRLQTLKDTRIQQMTQLNNIVNYGQNATKDYNTGRQNFGNNQLDLTLGSASSTGQTDAAKELAKWNSGDTWRMVGGVGDLAISGAMAAGGMPDLSGMWPDFSGSSEPYSAGSSAGGVRSQVSNNIPQGSGPGLSEQNSIQMSGFGSNQPTDMTGYRPMQSRGSF